MEKKIARLNKFYTGKTVKHNDEIGTVKSVGMMSGVMLEVEFKTHTALLKITEIALTTPSETK